MMRAYRKDVSGRGGRDSGTPRETHDATESGQRVESGEVDDSALDALRGYEIAENTKRSYRSQWRQFERWASLKGISTLPASPSHVALYLADRLFTLNHKPSTLRSVAAAIAHVHNAAGHPDPCADPEVRNTLRSASRMMGTFQQQADALTSQVFSLIIENAGQPRRGRGGRLESREVAELRGRLDVAMISLMRDGLLRVSEAAALKWEDLEFRPDGTGRLLLRKSKTDKEGRGAILFVSTSTMARLDSIRENAVDEDSVFGLSAHQMSTRIKKAAEAAGLGSGFSGHSPRVGMALDLARSGTELPSLMTAGRWSSPTMPALYTRNETAEKGAVAEYYREIAKTTPIESSPEGGISDDAGETAEERLHESGNLVTMTDRGLKEKRRKRPKRHRQAGLQVKNPVTEFIGESSDLTESSPKFQPRRENRNHQPNQSTGRAFVGRNLISAFSDADSLSQNSFARQSVEHEGSDRAPDSRPHRSSWLDGATAAAARRQVIRFLFLRCLPLALCIVAIGEGLSFLDWDESWVPSLYIALTIGLVLTHGLVIRDTKDGLREFFWVSVFLFLTTPMLQFVPIHMDPYGFCRLDHFTSAYMPFALCLLANLGIAASAGLTFHVLRHAFRDATDDGNYTLKQACAITLIPVGAVYAVVAVISNVSIWIQMGIALPMLAVAFTVLLVLFDRSFEFLEGDRQFLLLATFSFMAISVVLGIGIIVAFYMLPGVSQVIPHYNLISTWQVDFAETGLTQEMAADLLKIGYLWHATIAFAYMIIVVGGNVLVAVYHMGRKTGGQSAGFISAGTASALDENPDDDEPAYSVQVPRKWRNILVNFAGFGTFFR